MSRTRLRKYPRRPAQMRGAGLVTMLVTGACAEPEPWWTETEHLRVFGHRDTQLCAGTPPALEREVVRLLDVMRLPEPDETIDVVIGPEAADGCADAFAACAGRTDEGRRLVLSPLELVGHELVHALRQEAAVRGPTFYEEGLAEVLRAGALAGHVIASSTASPSEVEALQLTKLDTYEKYLIAASFMGWLHARTEPESFAASFSSAPYSEIATRDELDSWFVASFALSLDDATDLWAQDQPRDYWYTGPCIASEPIALLDGRAEESGRIDCDGNEATIGPYSDVEATVRGETRCVQIAGVEEVTISLDAPSSVWLELRPRLCESGQIPLTTSVTGGESQQLYLPAGSCWLELDARAASDVVAKYRWTLAAL